MKHNQNNRRQRSRGNGRRYPNQRGGAFESNGPEVKVRGTAQQVLEKYQSLARDAFSSGDRILAEGYLQHAEHYYRILNADQEGQNKDQNRDNGRTRSGRGNRDDDDFDGDDDNDNEEVAAKNADDKSNDGPETADVAAEASNENATSDGSSDDDQRPRRRGRRPRKAEQPDMAAVEASAPVEQPAVGD